MKPTFSKHGSLESAIAGDRTSFKIAGDAAKAFIATALLAAIFGGIPHAEPWAARGNLRLRHDLELLNDTGVMTNKLAGIDMRWRLPKEIPVALSMQSIARTMDGSN